MSISRENVAVSTGFSIENTPKSLNKNSGPISKLRDIQAQQYPVITLSSVNDLAPIGFLL